MCRFEEPWNRRLSVCSVCRALPGCALREKVPTIRSRFFQLWWTNLVGHSFHLTSSQSLSQGCVPKAFDRRQESPSTRIGRRQEPEAGRPNFLVWDCSQQLSTRCPL